MPEHLAKKFNSNRKAEGRGDKDGYGCLHLSGGWGTIVPTGRMDPPLQCVGLDASVVT